MKILLAILLVLVFSVGTVSADDGVPFTYNGYEYVYYPSLGETEDSIKAILDEVSKGPPPPPDWPIEAPKAPITYQGDGSGGDAIFEYDWTGQEVWLWT